MLNSAYPEPLSPLRLKMGFLNSDSTRLADRLVARQLVDRAQRPDNRRKVDVTINDNGRALLDQVMPELEKALDGFFQRAITKEEAVAGNKLLDKMRNLPV